MPKEELTKKWQEIGKIWLNEGLEGIDFGKGKQYIFLPSQKKFINAKNYHCLYYGGFGSGKTLGLIIKMILCCLCFPGNRVLLGRQYLSDIDKILLPDLFELLPVSYYNYRVKDGIIRFFNNSEIILFGLDALQAGPEAEIKKAQQKIKGLNLGQYFIDQLEEIEYEVFDMLNTRLRRTNVPFAQGNMTCNPANFWAYHYFIENQIFTNLGWMPSDKKKDACLVQASMLENKDNLREDYIEKQMEGHSEDWIKRYVLGEWSKDILVSETVFDKSYIQKWELLSRGPAKIEERCKIWEEYNPIYKYQMGIDPSEGNIDPSSVSVAHNNGKLVASYNNFATIPELADVTRFLYQKYGHPLIIPEVNGPGFALLENIKNLKIYLRTIFDHQTKRETKKLGWKTLHSTKPILIADFKSKINNIEIYDKDTIEEFKTFVWSDEARQKGAGAERGFHDDRVISTLLAFYGLKIEKKDTDIAHKEAIRKKLESLKGRLIQSPI